MLDCLKFEEIKKELPELKVVLIMPEDREGNYLYSTDLTDIQRVKDTWDIIKLVAIEYSRHLETEKEIYKFIYGVVRGINVAYKNRTWETKDSLLASLKEFGETNVISEV